jgi:hypothetical protein
LKREEGKEEGATEPVGLRGEEEKLLFASEEMVVLMPLL